MTRALHTKYATYCCSQSGSVMVMSHCYWLMLVHLLLILHSATPMHISYCGSDGSLITLGHNSCSGGFNFGPHKLSCVCISGM